MEEQQKIVDGIFEMIDMMIGALDSGFIDSNSLTISQIHQVARNHAKDTYGIEIDSLGDRHGHDLDDLCGRKSDVTCQQIDEIKPDQRIDAALDYVLRASGSALHHYTLHDTLEGMREAMRKAMSDSYIQGSDDCHRSMTEQKGEANNA